MKKNKRRDPFVVIKRELKDMSHADMCELAERCDISDRILYQWRDGVVISPRWINVKNVLNALGYQFEVQG